MIPFDNSGAFHPVALGSELRRLAVRGAAATISAAALGLAAQTVSTVILARLLTPGDFGVVAMVTTFSLLLMSVGVNGFEEAVIQRPEIDRFQASNLFWINCGIGVVLAAGFAGASSLLAHFYHNPLVTRVAIGVSPAIFLASTSVVHVALVKRAMQFTSISANDIIARVGYTVVALVLAWQGWGYWALVVGIVGSSLSTTIGAWWLCRWVPSLPRRGVGTCAVLKFAGNTYGAFIAYYFTRNFDNLLVGWRYNAVALGFYKKAYDLFALSASQLISPLHNVALAALSKLQDDPERFNRYLKNSLGIIAFVGMAVGADLTLVGKELVRLVLGPKWSESGRIFEMFGPGIGIMLLSSTACWIHLSIGKPERWLRWTIVESTTTGLLFVAALPWGPAGIAVAWSVSYWILLIPAFWYAGQPIGFGVSSLVAAVWRYVIAALVGALVSSSIVGHMLTGTVANTVTEALTFIVVKSLLFVILYLGAVILLYQGFDPLLRFITLVREILPGAGRVRVAAVPDGAS